MSHRKGMVGMRTLLMVVAALAVAALPVAAEDADGKGAEALVGDDALAALVAPWLYPEPAENAFPVYEQAFALLPDNADAVSDALDSVRATGQSPLPALAPNQAALAKLREALPLECLMPQLRSFSQALPYLAQSRQMARVLALEGVAWEMAGDPAQAYASYFDGIKLGRDMGRGGCTINGLVDIAVESTVLKQARLTARGGTASPEVLRGALDRLTQLEADAPEAAHTLAYELEALRYAVVEVADGTVTGDDLAQMLDAADRSEEAVARLRLDAAAFLPVAVDHFSRIIELSTQPYSDTIGLYPDPDESGNTFAQAVLPALQRVLESFARRTTTLRATRITVALEIYRQEHGALPETLDALAPDILPEVPIDAVSGAPFVYGPVPAADWYALYALGADLTDDGGSAEADLVYAPE
jgi:hypothetical protein